MIMKYIEELKYGNLFTYNNNFFVLTSDFKVNNNKTQHRCISIVNGNFKWFNSDTIVEKPTLFYQDHENNLKELKNE